MKARKYNTLRGLFRALKFNQFSLSEFLNGQIYTRKGWARFELSEDLKEKCLSMFASAIYERGAEMRKRDLLNLQDCGILRRVMIEQDLGNFRGSYCAGQDHTAEIRYIQCLVRSCNK